MKLKEKLGALSEKDAIDKLLVLNQFGSFINLMDEAVYEIDDPEITEKYNKLLGVIQSKREALGETEV